MLANFVHSFETESFHRRFGRTSNGVRAGPSIVTTGVPLAT
jgi:hypothetical protein